MQKGLFAYPTCRRENPFSANAHLFHLIFSCPPPFQLKLPTWPPRYPFSGPVLLSVELVKIAGQTHILLHFGAVFICPQGLKTRPDHSRLVTVVGNALVQYSPSHKGERKKLCSSFSSGTIHPFTKVRRCVVELLFVLHSMTNCCRFGRNVPRDLMFSKAVLKYSAMQKYTST